MKEENLRKDKPLATRVLNNMAIFGYGSPKLIYKEARIELLEINAIFQLVVLVALAIFFCSAAGTSAGKE